MTLWLEFETAVFTFKYFWTPLVLGRSDHGDSRGALRPAQPRGPEDHHDGGHQPSTPHARLHGHHHVPVHVDLQHGHHRHDAAHRLVSSILHTSTLVDAVAMAINQQPEVEAVGGDKESLHESEAVSMGVTMACRSLPGGWVQRWWVRPSLQPEDFHQHQSAHCQLNQPGNKFVDNYYWIFYNQFNDKFKHRRLSGTQQINVNLLMYV